MTDFPSIQTQLATQLVQSAQTGADDVDDLLASLVDAMPYFGDPGWTAAHRGAFVNLLESGLPNASIAPQPDASGFGYYASYSYDGSYSDYQQAFFGGVAQSAPAHAVAAAVAGIVPANALAWNSYAIAVLSDAIRAAGESVNSQQLANDLGRWDHALRPALSASCVAVYSVGFQPTATALTAIAAANQTAAAATSLSAAVTDGQFTANINQTIAMGGDYTNAAAWFLFNVWVALTTLGISADSVIGQAVNAGLQVPTEVAAGTWWTGGYTAWFPALSGADVASDGGGTIAAAMPEEQAATYGGSPVYSDITLPNGYAASVVNWGSLNAYKPPSSSCLGGATRVLMADGSARRVDEVAVGDDVRTLGGTGRVVLVESPRRDDRAVWQLDHLDAFLTGGHPVRLARPHGTASAEPWTTMDSVPTLSAAGVSRLAPGSAVVALDGSHTLERLVRHDRSRRGERVFDLVVDDGSLSNAPYYVGGPTVFVLVDAETADPLHDPLATLAVLSAMELALPMCSSTLEDPEAELPRLLSTIPLPELQMVAVSDAPRPAMPGPDGYLVDGAWDACAATLEAQLVIRYAPALAADAAHGWRYEGPIGQRRAFVHEIELVPEVAPAGPSDVAVTLRRADGTDSALRPTGPGPYRYRVGASAPVTGTVIDGEIRDGGATIGRFRFPFSERSVGRIQRPFLFGASGVVGRVAVELLTRRGETAAADWSHGRARARAISTGRAVGAAITGALERRPGGLDSS